MSRLLVGAAKSNINPTEEMMPYPSFNPEPYVGIFTDCNTRACVIDNGRTRACVMGFDLGGVPRPEKMKARLEKETGIPRENILLTATHNHTGCDIVMSRDPEDRKKADGYISYVMDVAAETAKRACGNMRPARYGYGEGKSYVNSNRDMLTEDGSYTQASEPEGYCDRTLSVLKFVDEEGKLICAIANYGMHATLGFFEVDADGQTRVSGNIPGVAAEYAETRFGEGAVVLWTSAAAGDQNPSLYCMRDYEPDGFPSMARMLPGMQYQLIKLVGKQHGVDICKTLNAVNTYNENMPIRFADNYLTLPGQRLPEGADPGKLNAWSNHLMRYTPEEFPPVPLDAPDRPVPLYIQEAVLGDVAFVGVAAEIYALIGKACKEASPYRKTMVVTHVGPNAGYIIDRTSTDHYCFEQFGPIKAGVCDEIIAEGVRKLFDTMMEE